MRLLNLLPLFVVGALLALVAGGGARAQSEKEPCTSFDALTPDAGGAFTVPLAYGSFADVEVGVGSTARGTVQLDVEVLQQSVIKDRRLWVLVPGRVVLLTEVLDVSNLFELGSPLLVRISASEPVSAVLVRRD